METRGAYTLIGSFVVLGFYRHVCARHLADRRRTETSKVRTTRYLLKNLFPDWKSGSRVKYRGI